MFVLFDELIARKCDVTNYNDGGKKAIDKTDVGNEGFKIDVMMLIDRLPILNGKPLF